MSLSMKGMVKMEKQIEILAPAGSYEGMKAAMNAGCDAVYIGGNNFGARAYANNLDQKMLLHAIDEAHIRNKKLYLTVNTLVKEEERIHLLYQFLEKLYLQGLDAVIVQDVGVMHFIHRHFPGLAIHASTQTTLTMGQGANLLKETGVTRLVTARELSFEEIKNIRKNTDLEIETFVHGALCYCYSGQCLMSSMIGGRSGNRGRCAQPCRMPYQFLYDGKIISSDKEKYLLSPKDISTLTLIPDLVDVGIDSFKIEGRMKRPEYAALIANIYRKYVDLYLEIGREKYQEFVQSKDFKEDMIRLMDIYNRGGFSTGYGKTYHGKAMMSMERPNHSGVYIGKVKSIKGKEVSIALEEDVNGQDILEIRDSDKDGYEFTLKDSQSKGTVLRIVAGKRPVFIEDKNGKKKIYKEPFIRVGDRVYRTKNNQLLEEIARDYIQKDKKQEIHGILKAKLGQRLELTIGLGEVSVTAYHNEVQVALKQPMTAEKLKGPIMKTGDTLFTFEDSLGNDNLKIKQDDKVFVPVAWLNEIRREAIQKLVEALAQRFRRDEKEIVVFHNHMDQKEERDDQPWGLCVAVQSQEQFDVALSYSEISTIYCDYDSFEVAEMIQMAKAAWKENKGISILLPHICRPSVYDKLKKDILTLVEGCEITSFIMKNFEEVALLESLKIDRSRFVLNYNMYIFNQEAKEFWKEQGINHFTAPVELNYGEMMSLGVTDCDFMVYGHIPLMVSVQCLMESTNGCQRCKGKGKNQGYLIDRLGTKFIVQTNCNGCYNYIYNNHALSLLKHRDEVLKLRPKNLRLDFTIESKTTTKEILDAFIKGYVYDLNVSLEDHQYTTGHFKRGVE